MEKYSKKTTSRNAVLADPVFLFRMVKNAFYYAITGISYKDVIRITAVRSVPDRIRIHKKEKKRQLVQREATVEPTYQICLILPSWCISPICSFFFFSFQISPPLHFSYLIIPPRGWCHSPSFQSIPTASFLGSEQRRLGGGAWKLLSLSLSCRAAAILWEHGSLLCLRSVAVCCLCLQMCIFQSFPPSPPVAAFYIVWKGEGAMLRFMPSPSKIQDGGFIAE